VMIGPSLVLLISDRIFPSLSIYPNKIYFTICSILLQVLEAIVWTFGRLRRAEHIQHGGEASKLTRTSRSRERFNHVRMYVRDTVFVTKCVGTLLLCVTAYVRSKYAVYFQPPTHPPQKKNAKKNVRIEKSPHTLRKEKTLE
jgi:hypothetical protein